MSRRDLGWRAANALRMKAGLRWNSYTPTLDDYPSVPQCVLLLLLVGILWAWCMDRDFAEQAEAEIERQAAIASQRTSELAECLNGTARFITEDQKTGIACRKAENFNL